MVGGFHVSATYKNFLSSDSTKLLSEDNYLKGSSANFASNIKWIYVELIKSGFLMMSEGRSLLIRSSHKSCSVKKGDLRNFVTFTEKHMRESLF